MIRADVARAIHDGYSNRRIAVLVGCSRLTVADTRAAMGLGPAPRVPTLCRNGHRRRVGGRCEECDRAAWDRRFWAVHEGHRVTEEGPTGRRRCLQCTPHRFDVDEVAVLRAVAGDPPQRLNPAERAAAVLQLHERQLPPEVIAERVGCSVRTVWRVYHRARTGHYEQAA